MSDSRKKFTVYSIAVILLLILFIIIFLLLKNWEDSHSDFLGDSDFEMAGVLEHNGSQYVLRHDVESILVIGLDKYSRKEVDQGSYNNESCADFLSLVVIDKTNQSYTIIHLNRDTITEITKLGIGGKHVGKINAQLALSHTYGSGKDDSCINTMRAVSAIFGGLRIDRYLSVTMDSVGVLNDMVGGVTLTVLDDLTSIAPALVEGESVHLTGDLALAYVRSRSGLFDDSNVARMERQRQYMDGLYDRIKVYGEENSDFAINAVTKLSKSMTTNCSANELEKLFDKLSAYEKQSFITLTGEYKVEDNVEFYPSEESVKQVLVDLFYQPKSDS